MEQHPIPRQITTFEFKLIGFMTLKQFLYLLVFLPAGFLTYSIFPIPFLNILLGVVVGLVGVALAFMPLYDRPLDVWAKNLLKRLISPTQYKYEKDREPLYFFKDLFFVQDPHKVVSHVESQEKLNKYLAGKEKKNPLDLIYNMRRQIVGQAIQNPQELPPQPRPQPTLTGQKKPFLVGVVKNNKKLPLPGVLIYIKDQKDTPIRLLKTNPHGVFATYSDLSPGDYDFEIKDPQGRFVFDRIKVKLSHESSVPLEFFSKELL